ncbi:MAG: hypothetical protein OHK0029_13350 [Armatimonadaceae bacterium]
MGFFKFNKREDEKPEESKVEETSTPTGPEVSPRNTVSDVRVSTPPVASVTPVEPLKPVSTAPVSTPETKKDDTLPTEAVPTLGAPLGATLGSPTAKAATPAPAPKPEPAPATPKQTPDVASLRRLVEQAVLDSEGSKLEAVRLGTGSDAPPLMSGKTLNFPALYSKVSLPEPTFSAEQMLEMLGKLPTEMPLEMKRKTVDVALGMLGKHINTNGETLVTDTTRKMTTLATFAQEYEKKTSERVAATETEIAALLAQVEEKRQAVKAANERLATVQEICVAETDRLDNVLEFFKSDAPDLIHQVFGKGKGDKEGKQSKAAARFAMTAKPSLTGSTLKSPATMLGTGNASTTPAATKPDLTLSDTPKSEPVKAEVGKTEAGKTDAPKPGLTLTDTAKPDSSEKDKDTAKAA